MDGDNRPRASPRHWSDGITRRSVHPSTAMRAILRCLGMMALRQRFSSMAMPGQGAYVCECDDKCDHEEEPSGAAGPHTP